MAMPAVTVVGPARTPAPFGLFSTFAFRPDSGRWGGSGVTFETPGCGPLLGIGFGDYCADPATVPGLPRQPIDPAPMDTGTATPFTVLAEHSCSPVGNSAAQARDLAGVRLASIEERAVEYAFATGALGNEPNLASATELTAGPVGFDVAIGLLEEWLATEYGAQGVIHAPRSVVGSSPFSVRVSGQTLRTTLGTPVAAGSGYGTGPGGLAAGAGVRWVFATPALAGYRSEIATTDAFEYGTNDQSATAQRDYLFMFEDCGGVAAVQVGVESAPAMSVDPNPYLIIQGA